MWDENNKAHIPPIPNEFRLFKVVNYFNLDKDREYTEGEIEFLYNRLKLFNVIEQEEFPTSKLF